MIVESITTRQFRNLTALNWKPFSGLNILIGKNGQGKTNLLESIYFAASTRSCRINDSKAMIQHDKDNCVVEMQYYSNHASHNVKMVIYNQGKSIFDDGKLLKRSSDYIGKCLTVIFLPSDVSLLDEQPSQRRSMIDQELAKCDRDYLNALMNYNALLKKRNLLLKQDNVDDTYLDVLTDQLIQVASIIIYKRNQLINYLNQTLPRIYSDIMNEASVVTLQYKTSVDCKNNISTQLKKLYQANISNDKLNKVTTIGCHKDDFLFYKDNYLAKTVASQGQKRALILAYKLAINQWIHDTVGQYPILLLDDVLSELDTFNQQHLLTLFNTEQQTIVTTCQNEDWFNKVASVTMIENGRIVDQRRISYDG